MTIDTGVGLAVAIWAFLRTWGAPTKNDTVALIDLVVCVILAVFIVKGIFS